MIVVIIHLYPAINSCFLIDILHCWLFTTMQLCKYTFI